MRTRCTRFGVGEKGRTSCTIVWDDREGERRYDPFGDSARDVGVSVWPVRVYTSAFLRKSRT